SIVGCDTFGSTTWRWFHPDLYLYGIHGVEPLFAVMGTGCVSVTRIVVEGESPQEMAVGVWKDGRIGTFRDLRGGKSECVARIYGTKGIATAETAGYGQLLTEIVRFFKTGKVPVPPEETIEIFAFMTAADVSKARGGAPVTIAEVREEAKRENEARRRRGTRRS